MPHIHEKIDFTVSAIIVHKDKVLLRKHEKYKKWLYPGGHIELDEDPNQAVIREAKEEVGLDITLHQTRTVLPAGKNDRDLIAPVYVNRHKINDTHEHVDFLYFASTDDPTVRVEYEGDSSDEWHWFSADELDDLHFGVEPRVIFYSKEALKTVGKKH